MEGVASARHRHISGLDYWAETLPVRGLLFSIRDSLPVQRVAVGLIVRGAIEHISPGRYGMISAVDVTVGEHFSPESLRTPKQVDREVSTAFTTEF